MLISSIIEKASNAGMLDKSDENAFAVAYMTDKILKYIEQCEYCDKDFDITYSTGPEIQSEIMRDMIDLRMDYSRRVSESLTP